MQLIGEDAVDICKKCGDLLREIWWLIDYCNTYIHNFGWSVKFFFDRTEQVN